MKKYILIIGITALCFGNINSQVIVLVDTTLSGSQTGNNNYTAFDNIESTQIINSGKTTYTAGNEILLNPGFEVKLGAEFEATVDNSLHIKTMMTYNLWYKEFYKNQDKHADVINSVSPDVVALQEIQGKGNFKNLQTLTGMKGEICYTLNRMTNGVSYKTGVGILYKSSLGTPKITSKWLMYFGTTFYGHTAYIIAEFEDFCFISVHYPTGKPTKEEDGKTMTNKILKTDVVQNCKISGKPIYIAGDFNVGTTEPAIQLFVDDGFEKLIPDTIFTYPTFDKQETGNYTGPYSNGDLIIEYNTNPNRKTIEHDYPDFPTYEHQIASDHFPYYVKRKIK